MDFEEYLKGKKIDSEKFKKSEPETFTDWKNEFGQMSAESFSFQKKFKLNPIRLKYHLKSENQ